MNDPKNNYWYECSIDLMQILKKYYTVRERRDRVYY